MNMKRRRNVQRLHQRVSDLMMDAPRPRELSPPSRSTAIAAASYSPLTLSHLPSVRLRLWALQDGAARLDRRRDLQGKYGCDGAGPPVGRSVTCQSVLSSLSRYARRVLPRLMGTALLVCFLRSDPKCLVLALLA